MAVVPQVSYQAALAVSAQRQVFSERSEESIFTPSVCNTLLKPVGSFGVYFWSHLFCITAFSQSVSSNAARRNEEYESGK